MLVLGAFLLMKGTFLQGMLASKSITMFSLPSFKHYIALYHKRLWSCNFSFFFRLQFLIVISCSKFLHARRSNCFLSVSIVPIAPIFLCPPYQGYSFPKLKSDFLGSFSWGSLAPLDYRFSSLFVFLIWVPNLASLFMFLFHAPYFGSIIGFVSY